MTDYFEMVNDMCVKRVKYGTRRIPGQSWSTKFPGHIDCGNGVYRKPIAYRGGSSNLYFVERSCTSCGSSMLQSKANAQRSEKSFCSKECLKAHRVGLSAGNKIVKRRPNGQHILIKCPNHPRKSRHGLVYEHVLVAEKSLGRFLTAKERVHHINCVKDDNRPENLFVCATDSEHFKIHGSLNACVADLISIGALIFDKESKTYQVSK